MEDTNRQPGTSRTGRNRLRNEIVGGALLVTLTLLLLFMGYTYFQAREVRTATAVDTLEAVASVQEARIQTYVDGGRSDLALLASRPQLRQAVDDLNRARDPDAVEEIGQVLDAARDASFDIETILIFDPELELIAGSGPDQLEVPDGYLAGASTETVVGLITMSGEGEYVHLVAGPLVTEGRSIGVAVVGQSTAPLFDVVQDHTGLGRTGEIILARAVEGEARYIAPLRFRPQATLQPIDESIASLPMNRALAGVEAGATEGIDYRGAEVLAVTRFVDGPDWGLVAKIDRDDALSPVGDFVLVAAAGLAAALVLAYFIATRAADMILRPIRRLTETATAIASGRRDLRAGSDRDDEIGELAEAFDQMTVQLNALTSELEERVEERTRELREKNAQLARLMQDKETFLAGVSHEVRSPLTAMIGFIELVNDAGEALESDERTEMLETVSRQADDVLNLIEDLLASARAEAGTLNVVEVRVDLAAQARQVIETLGKNIRPQIDLEGAARASADPARVRQIIRNLLTNADRYGGANVEIVVTGEDDWVAIEVRDDGEGVPEEDRNTIFEAYGQSEGSRSVHDSVGLGLHVSRELARLMGGDLTYRYQDGWSIFRLSLPPHPEEAEEEPKAAKSVGVPAVSSTSLSNS